MSCWSLFSCSRAFRALKPGTLIGGHFTGGLKATNIRLESHALLARDLEIRLQRKGVHSGYWLTGLDQGSFFTH